MFNENPVNLLYRFGVMDTETTHVLLSSIAARTDSKNHYDFSQSGTSVDAICL